MNCARNYENLLNVVKVIPTILGVPFFPDTVYDESQGDLVIRDQSSSVGQVPDLSMWRPWAGSLLEAPTHPQMQ